MSSGVLFMVMLVEEMTLSEGIVQGKLVMSKLKFGAVNW